MPVDSQIQESSQEQKIKPFLANKIAQILTEQTQGKKAHARRAKLKMCIAQAMSVSLTKVTRLLNNTDQPTTPELATIAQVLKVTTDELIKLEE